MQGLSGVHRRGGDTFTMNITSCTVRVIRSYDYCHFEVSLTAEAGPLEITASDPIPPEDVDELRKRAARLADKAVEQYKIKKAALEEHGLYETARLRAEVTEISKKPEHEWTPEEKASVKRYGDILHRRSYDYQDDWQQEDES